MAARKIIAGRIDVNVLLAFVFGVVFLLILLVFSVVFRDLSDVAKQVFITVLAIAAAGVGAVIPGLLKVNVPFAEAGGALAVFLLVFLNEPAIVRTAKTVDDILRPPDKDADLSAVAYLDIVGNGKFEEGWAKLDEAAKGFIVRNKAEYIYLYDTAMKKVGAPIKRQKIGTGGVASPPGYPNGFYKTLNYITEYSNGKCYPELVVVRAETEDSDWVVFEHLMGISPIPC